MCNHKLNVTKFFRWNVLQLLVMFGGLYLLPLNASAADLDVIEGKLNGIHCAQQGLVCPIDEVDAMVALESDFVVMVPDGTYYSIINLDRAVKARHVLENVRVTGKASDRYKSISATKLEVEKEGGKYRTVWSLEMQRRTYDSLRIPGATRP